MTAVAAAIGFNTTDQHTSARLAGLLAALLAALHPLSVYYSQEARMYALLGLASSITLWAALRLVRRVTSRRANLEGGRRRVLLSSLGLGVSIAAGLYTQYTYLLPLVGLNLAVGGYLVAHARRRWRLAGAWFAAHALGGAVFLPWAPIALNASDWRPPDLAPSQAVRAMAQTLVGGVTLAEPVPAVSIATAAVLCLGAAILSFRAQRTSVARFTLWAALGMAFIPPMIIAGTGIYRPAYLKFLIAGVVPLVVCWASAWGWVWAPSQGHPAAWVRRVAVAGGVLALVLPQVGSLHTLYTDESFARDDYRGIAAWLRTTATPDDAILLNAPNQWEVFTYYYGSESGDQTPVYPAPYRPDQEEALNWVEDIVADHLGEQLFVLTWGDTESDPQHHIERALAMHAYKASEEWVTTVRVARYGTAPLVEQPAKTLDVRVGEHIYLIGYHLPGAPQHPGAVLPVTLFWTAEAMPSERAKVFVHLVGSDTGLAAQVDMEPQAGLAPTTLWRPGETVTDRYGVYLPEDLQPGDYTLLVGMYGFDGVRLPLAQAEEPVRDALELATVKVTCASGDGGD
jgi:hypothetical protein